MLHIDAVTKTYPGVRALDRATLDVGSGVFGLLGPNGAGKTTLMQVIATLLDPDAGAVSFDGLDFLSERLSARRILGYLPQEFGFYPTLTARQTMNYFARLKGMAVRDERRRTIDSLLERVNLLDAGDRPVGEFSGGMRQRLGIAQALLGEPRLLIVDEPTAGLDPEERNRLHDLLADAAANDVTVLLSTHIVADVANLCSRFAILHNGRIVRMETPSSALASLRGVVWEGSISVAALQALPPDAVVISSRRFEGALRVRVVAPGGQPSPSFTMAEPTVEDYYFSVLREDGTLQ
jgi:ABC-2 type transport system ATP-binding protein